MNNSMNTQSTTDNVSLLKSIPTFAQLNKRMYPYCVAVILRTLPVPYPEVHQLFINFITQEIHMCTLLHFSYMYPFDCVYGIKDMHLICHEIF